MRYMLMMHVGHDDGREVLQWAPQDVKNMIEFQHTFDRELEENGEMVFNAGLSWPDQARIVPLRRWGAGRHGRAVPRGQGVPHRLLGRRVRQRGAGVCHRCPGVVLARPRRGAHGRADRGAPAGGATAGGRLTEDAAL